MLDRQAGRVPLVAVITLAVIALGVLSFGGYRVLKHMYPPVAPSADQAIKNMASTTAAMTSANANFTTQVSGLTVMFGTARERVRPTTMATLTMTSVDGADRFAVTEVISRSTLYVSMPSLAVAYGKPWLGVPVPMLAADPAMAQLYQTAALPTAEAALIGTATTERMTGTTTVRGIKVSRYVGSIVPATALSELAPAQRQLLAPELAATTGTITFTAWIDAQYNLRKIQTTAIIGGRSTVTTVVITAINRVLRISVPQSGEVAVISS